MTQILLIEPDKLLSNSYSKALKSVGYEVDAAKGSQEAIYIADKIKPDVVILELQLISHSGIEFLYEFRSYPDWQDIPVLLHTNVPYVEIGDNWQYLNDLLGVKRYLYKPTTTLQDLIANVNQVFSNKNE